MPDTDPLEQLSSKELHDLALRRARRHLDVGFLWQLMKVLPAAEAATGDYWQSDPGCYLLDDEVIAGSPE